MIPWVPDMSDVTVKKRDWGETSFMILFLERKKDKE